MPLITWKDTAFAEAEGPVRFRDLTVAIRAEHIAQWKDDPDGRYKLKSVPADPQAAELDRFFPSL